MNKMVKLSNRLEAIAQMVGKGKVACDLGCDHGFVSIYLIQQGICPSVLAMDVRTGPLSQAKVHVMEAGLEDRIEVRLSDGLENYIEGEAQSLILAGMGGRLMMRILANKKAETFEELILSPQSELCAFRRFIREQGWETIAENLIYEDGKYYPVMKVFPSGKAALYQNLTKDELKEKIPEEIGFCFGELLLQQRNPVLKQYLQEEKAKREALIRNLSEQGHERGTERIATLEAEWKDIKWALDFYERRALWQKLQ